MSKPENDRKGQLGPTVRPPAPGSLNSALERNIEALQQRRKRDAEQASLQARIAQAITRFTGSMRFVYLHLALNQPAVRA